MSDSVVLWGGLVVVTLVSLVGFYPYWRETWEQDLERLRAFVRRKLKR